MENFKNYIVNFWQTHNYATKCAIIGLLCGLAIVLIGFWKTLFVALCVVIGVAIGKAKDNNVDLKDLAAEILNKFKR